MESRHRTYDTSSTNVGTLWVYLGPTTTTRTGKDLVTGDCYDVVGNYTGDNAFTLEKVWTTVAILNGEEWYYPVGQPPRLSSRYTNCPSYWQPSPKSVTSKWADPLPAALLAMAPEIVARTNPSAPHIGTPTSIGELRDVPGSITGLLGLAKVRNVPATVYNYGVKLIQAAATGYITWRWAVKPMIADVRRLFSFQEAVLERFTELNKLATSSSIKKRVHLGKVQEDITENVTLESSRASCTAYRDTHYEKDEWATVRWRMNEITSDAWLANSRNDVMANYKMAERICAGITSQEALATAWELLPWSWFYDWFGSVGDNIAAARNSAGAYPIAICFMRTTSSCSKYRIKTKSSWLNVKLGEETRIRKGRWIVPTSGYTLPSVGMPILTGRHWSILLALAAVRGLKVTRPPKKPLKKWDYIRPLDKDAKPAFQTWTRKGRSHWANFYGVH